MNIQQQVFKKLFGRLMPLIMSLYFISFVDRANIGIASLTMNQDLGIGTAAYGFGAGLFFIGYFLFGLPSNVILIAATNHEHLLDPAIWRRFNVTITLDLPATDQRKALIQNGLSKYGIKTKIDVNAIAKVTEGMSGALIDELMLAAAKKYLIDGSLKTADVTAILIQQKTKYSDNNDESMKVICDMLDKGVSLRAAASALGISHSTLEYQVKKYRGDE